MQMTTSTPTEPSAPRHTLRRVVAGAIAAIILLGLALMADFYDTLTGQTTYRAFGEAQRDWALGANAWGVSFVVGAGDTFPLCLHHQIANLVGSLRGPAGGPILLGATVDGPQPPDALQGLSLPDGAPLLGAWRPLSRLCGPGRDFRRHDSRLPLRRTRRRLHRADRLAVRPAGVARDKLACRAFLVDGDGADDERDADHVG